MLLGTSSRLTQRLSERVGPFVRERGVASVLTSCVLRVGPWLLGRPRAGRPKTRTFRYAGRRVPSVHERYSYTGLDQEVQDPAEPGRALRALVGQLAPYDRLLHTAHGLLVTELRATGAR